MSHGMVNITRRVVNVTWNGEYHKESGECHMEW